MDKWVLLGDDLVDLTSYLHGVVYMGVLLNLDSHCKTSVIRRWEELGRHLLYEQERHAEECHEYHDGCLAPLNNEAQSTLVGVIQPVQSLVDRLI